MLKRTCMSYTCSIDCSSGFAIMNLSLTKNAKILPHCPGVLRIYSVNVSYS